MSVVQTHEEWLRKFDELGNRPEIDSEIFGVEGEVYSPAAKMLRVMKNCIIEKQGGGFAEPYWFISQTRRKGLVVFVKPEPDRPFRGVRIKGFSQNGNAAFAEPIYED